MIASSATWLVTTPDRLSVVLGLIALFVPLGAWAEPAPSDGPVAPAPSVMVAQAPAESGTLSEASGSDGENEEEDEPSDFFASLTISQDVATAGLLASEADRLSMSMGFSPVIGVRLGDGMTLRGGVPFAWYQINDSNASLADHTFLVGDPYIDFTHSKVFADEDLGLSISLGVRLSAGASLSSRFQNRVVTIRPSAGLRWNFGPVTLGYSLRFAKYFNTSNRASVDCGEFGTPNACPTNRTSSASQVGFQAEARGGDYFVPGSGVSSFYVSNGISLSVRIIEGLTASAGVSIFNIFGYSSFEIDGMSSANAVPGRRQTDRLVASIGLDYQIMKNLGLGLSFSSDSTTPLGPAGGSLDLFNVQNGVTALSLSLTVSI